MAWIAAVAVAAMDEDDRRHGNDSVWLSVCLLVGSMVPLALVLFSMFEVNFFPIILVGIITFTVFGVFIIWAIAVYNNSHSNDQNDDRSASSSHESYRNESTHKIPELTPISNYCSGCGEVLELDDRFCTTCGRRTS
ncbi:MAG: hypothetical protein ACXAC8_16920 [Candidatus Hodarchaeales archaeon]|jgi:hypothetical protein